MHAQQEIGFIEKFALTDDRREALAELIPGTEEYFFFHCLHFQNEKQLPEAEAILTQWRSKFGDTGQVQQMLMRQVILSYDENPQRTLETLRLKLQLNLEHSPPTRDRAATLRTQFDNSIIATAKFLEEVLALDRSLSQIETSSLRLVVGRQLAPDQLRALLSRLDRTDIPQVVDRIAEELSLKDSRGFGWTPLHEMLTKEQLDALVTLRPELLENTKFVRVYSAQLAPAEGSSLIDKAELRRYLDRLRSWSQRLPASQNSFKAFILGNLLRLDMSEKKFDRELFLEYLALPRSAVYYDLKRYGNNRVPMADLGFTMAPEVSLPAVGDDTVLVSRYLEHFLQNENSVDAFAQFLDRDYLNRVFAETKILHGSGDPATWYSKLSPGEQRALRERIEIRFAPHNEQQFKTDDSVSLDVELKNVPELIVKIYEINTAAFLRDPNNNISTDLDLDGLVANHQRRLEFSQAAHLRHTSRIDLPELKGRGVWVVDLLGNGQRSRALIHKGELMAVERMGDAGHVFEILDENGKRVDTAHIEFAGQKYSSDDGKILIPYAESAVTRNLLVVDRAFASRNTFLHSGESYQLQAGFLLDRQSLVAGSLATVAIRSRLTCNDRPISISLLENPQLTITATDADGIATSQTITNLDLDDGDELAHDFLVPQRLRSLEFRLSGEVVNQNRAERQSVNAAQSILCNGITSSIQIGDFFLQQLSDGYRILVLGRNGEPIPRLPISLTFKSRHFKTTKSLALATDNRGVTVLGAMDDIEFFSCSAQGIKQTLFNPKHFHRDWPSVLQLSSDDSVILPLGKATSKRESFSFHELRRDRFHADHSEKLELDNGSLRISDLAPGNYLLKDHEGGQLVRIAVSDGTQIGHFVIGKHRILQAGRRAPIVIRDARIEGDSLLVEVDGADAMTRLHVVGDTFLPNDAMAQQINLPTPPLMSLGRISNRSLFVNSLRLDEEYSYILDRQGLKKFPGNMLPQPSLLIHPWEVSVTENKSKQAALGDAMPASPALGAPIREFADHLESQSQGTSPDWKCFDFLASGAAVATNLGLQDGKIKIPLKSMQSFSSLTVLAVHPTSVDSRHVVMGDGSVSLRDQRLRSAFDAETHLAQTQQVQLLNAGERRLLGDPKTRRLQTYTTIADVFQLYSTLLNNDSRWEKFRFLGRWRELSDEQKKSHYNEMACHELNFFLFHKDREFFDAVAKPLIQQKMQKQLVDNWLLGNSIETYGEVWRIQRLNTLERILLAQQGDRFQSGTTRWLSEFLAANPIDPQARQQRFDVALRGNALEASDSNVQLSLQRRSAVPEPSAGGGMGGGGAALPGIAMMKNAPSARELRSRAANASDDKAEAEGLATTDFFSVERLSRGIHTNDRGLFQSLDKTREWAETNYYQIKRTDQTKELIEPNPFWEQFLAAGGTPFLPRDIDLPANSISEAICALAVIDLPFTADSPKLSVEDDQLIIHSITPAIIFLESIETSQLAKQRGSVLVGQDIYLANPGTNDEVNRPVQSQPLLRGMPYRATVVVTNPTNEKRRVQLLTQLPAGSVPLAGSRTTRSTTVAMEAYSTAQVSYTFYFPSEGDFAHYGSQISTDDGNIADTESMQLRVLSEPESVDDKTWSYIADWGTNAQVLEFLQTANLHQLDLSRIAFRMLDKDFYTATIELLTQSGKFEPTLWAYSVRHNDPLGIEQLLQNRPDFILQLGRALESSLLEVRPAEQMSYEHLDYKPLIVARAHQLGSKPLILNASMHTQYHRLLDVLAHQPSIAPSQAMQICYYLLLQNRIPEALEWFAKVDAARLETQLQYDYFDAYLEFYRGDYPRASRIAGKYLDYSVPRWNDLFLQIREQIQERERLFAGQASDDRESNPIELDPTQKILTDQRQNRQIQLAQQTPSIELVNSMGELSVRSRNIEQIQVNYYLMDIELRFSRKPFVSQDQEASPIIQPNLTEIQTIAPSETTRVLDLPAELRNKNVLVEINAAGISRSSVITANALSVDIVEPFGTLQVLAEKGRGPVEGAYVKVYARHSDGSVRFYKDGYTDLRGQFDYATLSTGDLDSSQRFAILVLDEQLGASVHEAEPPTR